MWLCMLNEHFMVTPKIQFILQVCPFSLEVLYIQSVFVPRLWFWRVAATRLFMPVDTPRHRW